MHYRNYRIPDEVQLFEVGDKALLHDKTLVTIKRVHDQTVYYEARPIACYQAFQYAVVDENNKSYYVETKDLSQIEEK